MKYIDGHEYKDDPFDFSDELTLEGEPTIRDIIITQYELALQRTQLTLDVLKAGLVDEDSQDCLREEQAMLLEVLVPILLWSIENEDCK